MTALARSRDTKRYGVEPLPAKYAGKVKAATKLFTGSLVVIDAGYLAPGRAATGLIALGRCEGNEDIDNSAGAAGDKTAEVLSGVFKWANHGADLVVQADVGKDCFIVDDQTVAKTDGTATRSRAGKVVSVESDGVYVLMGLAV